MPDEELLIECKVGLGIPIESTEFDPVLKQKLRVVKSFIKGAGVSNEMLEDDLAIGTIVLGVSDIWNLVGGESKFSNAFIVLVSQLAIRSGSELNGDG